MVFKEIVIWFEVRQLVDIELIRFVEHIHQPTVRQEWHPFPSRVVVLPAVFQNNWLDCVQTNECTLFKFQNCASVGLIAFRVNANWGEARILFTKFLSLDNFINISFPLFLSATS